MRNPGATGLARLALIFLVVTVWLTAVSWSRTAAQEPPPDRPQPPPDVPGPPPGRTHPPVNGSGGSGADHGGGGYTFSSCVTVHGVVINWGYRYEPKVPLTLSGPGWQTQKVTDDNGYYASDCLGFGVTLLNPASPPWLHSLTSDVAIRSGYRPDFEVNLGLYGGEVAPPVEVTPSLTVIPDQARLGQIVTYTIQVTNTLRSPGGSLQTMGGVMITDLLPQALTPITATSTAGMVEWWGNLLTVDLGELPPGQTLKVIVTAKVPNEAQPAAVIANRASLLYTGHVTVQTPTVEVGVRR